jgi:hypothetical protein
VKPFKVHDVYLEKRPEADYQAFLKKFKANKEKSKQMELGLFGDLSVVEIKKLQFLSQRFKVKWSCDRPDCPGHDMSILDWEVYELQRKIGDYDSLERVRSRLTSPEYNVGFFLGNFRLHPTAFSIGGLWYPKKNHIAPNLKLF